MMVRLSSLTVLLLLCICFQENLLAQQSDRFELGLSLRMRWEDKQDFNFNTGEQSYLLTQVRLNGRYNFSKSAHVFVELQDARIHGEEREGVPAVNEDAVPNIFADELDLHQAYLAFKAGQGQVKIGRQKLNLADKRMVASLEWVNTARVLDGIRYTFGGKNERQFEVWATKPVTVNPNDPNDWANTGNRYFDSTFYGLMFSDPVSIDAGRYELFLLVRDNSDFNDTVFNLGGRLVKTFNKLTIDAQGHLQFGDWSDTDHQASAYAVLAQYQTEVPFFKTIAFGYLSASGDDDINEGDHDTFDNFYPLNHAYYGFMDFFGWQNMTNIELIFSGQAFPGGKWRVALHRFEINEATGDYWYNAGLGRLYFPTQQYPEDHAGDEIDFTLAFPLFDKKINMLLGYSIFQVGDYIEARGRTNDATFWYAQAAYKWSMKR